MKVLITGGAGFIGSHLAERLLSEGHSVVVLDDLSTGSLDNLNPCHEKQGEFSFVEGTILDRDLVEQLISDTDLVYHLAAAVGVKLIMDEPSKSILTNVMGTENVLNACVANKRRVLIASSSEVYGKAVKFPLSEEDNLIIGATVNLRWSYACAKTLDEFLALSYVREAELPATVFRLFNTTGPRQTGRYGMVLPSFVEAALRGQPLKVHGTGEQSRCFGHVFDIVDALVLLAQTPGAIGEVINIGNEGEVTIRALAEQIRDAVGSTSEIQLIPYSEAYQKGFEDMQRRVPDVSKLERITGFRPRRSLEQIIEDVIADKRKSLGI